MATTQFVLTSAGTGLFFFTVTVETLFAILDADVPAEFEVCEFGRNSEIYQSRPVMLAIGGLSATGAA